MGLKQIMGLKTQAEIARACGLPKMTYHNLVARGVVPAPHHQIDAKSNRYYTDDEAETIIEAIKTGNVPVKF